MPIESSQPSALHPLQKSEMTTGGSDITELLNAWSQGDGNALESLIPQVVDELRRLAASHLRKESKGHTLQPTALVNEVYLRLSAQLRSRFQNRTQFFAFASSLMRRILVDHYRARCTAKRGDGEVTLSLDEALGLPGLQNVELLALHDALKDLETLDSRQSKVVELRFFGGLKVPEVATVLHISPATVKREWTSAKAFLLDVIRVS